jgi:hypothetical protein
MGLSDSLTLEEGSQSSVQHESAMMITVILTSELCGIGTPKAQDSQFQSPAMDMLQSHLRVPTAFTIILSKVNLFATLSGSPLKFCHFPLKCFCTHVPHPS